MDITPAPRLLSVLGEIELDEWQCLAEIIDNSFDAFLKMKRAGKSPSPGGWRVDVELPTDQGPNGKVLISDNGPGMSKEQLQNSLRAGFSSNDKYSNLGLFGMGFNVATARLGMRTTVKTSTAEGNFWNSVTVDFDKLIRANNFEAEEGVEEKISPHEHGTTVEVSVLRDSRAKFLQLNTKLIQKKLENVYSFLLDKEGFSLYLNGQQLHPRKACVWGEGRSTATTLGGTTQNVPAQIKLDFPLTPVSVCKACDSHKLESNQEQECECGGSEFTVLERRIHGWIGVQRYLHPSEYGIDFLRNGRKILTFDKRLFSWRDPNDPNSSESIEYPSELAHQGGRIVGEIHVDHIEVVYTKDAFEFKSTDWATMVRLIRGDGPIRPKIARNAGYQENLTPLARLVRAFAKNNPGTEFLHIGDGKVALHVQAREWGQKFHEGDPEYQDDSKWWEAAENHDRLSISDKQDSGGDDVPDIFDDFPNPPEPETEEVGDKSFEQLSVNDQLSQLESVSSLDSSLSVKSVFIGGTNMGVATRILSSSAPKHVRHFVGSVRLIFGKKNSINVFVNALSPIFLKRGYEIGQYVAVEIASVMSQRIGDTSSNGKEQVINSLFNAGFVAASGDQNEVRAEVQKFFQDVTQAMSEDDGLNPAAVMPHLRKLDEQELRDSFAMANPNGTLDFSDRSIFGYFTPTLITQLAISSPETLLNGRVLTRDITSSGLGEQTKRIFAWETTADLIRLGAFLKDPQPNHNVIKDAQTSLERVRKLLNTGDFE